MLREVISNSFNLNINKDELIPPVIVKEVISNNFNLNINKEEVIPPEQIETLEDALKDYTKRLEHIRKCIQAANEKIADNAFDSKTQEEIFNKLTNNGQLDGLFMQDGKLYIQGEMIAGRKMKSEYLEAVDLDVSGTLSAETLMPEKFIYDPIALRLTQSVSVYIDSTNGNNFIDFENGAVYQSLQAAIDSAPRTLNGYTINFYLKTDIYEDVIFDGFNGGTVNLQMQMKNIYGYVRFSYSSARMQIYGNTTSSTLTVADGTVRPNIKPSTPATMGAYKCALGITLCPYAMVRDVCIWGKHPSDYNGSAWPNYCSIVECGSHLYLRNVKIGGGTGGFRIMSGAHVIVENVYGKVVRNAFDTSTGAFLSIPNTDAPSGGSSNYYIGGGCFSSIGSSVKWYGGGTSNNDNVTVTTKITTITANSADAYRTTVYNNWKKDNIARQGNYGYGICKGLWFFGDKFEALKGKTITKVQIQGYRQDGGVYANVNMTMYMHNYRTRPSGNPTLISGWTKTVTAAHKANFSVTITDSTVLTAIKNGTMKGFAIYNSSSNKSYYAVCSSSLKCVVTYKD